MSNVTNIQLARDKKNEIPLEELLRELGIDELMFMHFFSMRAYEREENNEPAPNPRDDALDLMLLARTMKEIVAAYNRLKVRREEARRARLNIPHPDKTAP